MKGTIKAYSSCVNAGVIQGDDGTNYGFREEEWKGHIGPKTDHRVDFSGYEQTARHVTINK